MEFAIGRRLFPETIQDLLIPVGGFDEAIARALDAVRGRLGDDVHGLLRELLATEPSARPPSALDAARRFARAALWLRVQDAARARTGASSLLGVERGLPRPIALMARAWRLTRSPRDRALLAFSLGECVARFLAAVMLADYLTDAARDDRVEAFLADRLRDPSFGVWVEVARETARVLRRRRPLFVPAMAEFFDKTHQDSGLRALEALVPERNVVVHGRLVIPDGDLPALEERVDALVRRLLDALRFIGSATMFVSIDEETSRDGSKALTVLDLLGTAPEPEERELRVERCPPKGCVCLTSERLDARLVLDPFVLWRPCARCGGTHAFVIAGIEDGKVRYLDAATGHELVELPRDERSRSTSFAKLIARREALCLRGDLGSSPEDALRFVEGDRSLRPGVVWADHVLEEEVGRGAMGVVFRARHCSLDEVRAVKIIRPEFLQSEGRGAVRRLQREAATMARLKGHPGVVRVLDFRCTDDDTGCALVMEFVESGSLDDRLRRSPAPTLDEVIGVAAQLCDALGFMHREGVVHRDLKPSNVLVGTDGRLRISDFGLASNASVAPHQSAHALGSACWRAPEQFDSGLATPASDLHALGLILFDLLIGCPAASPATERRALLRRLHAVARSGHPIAEFAHHGVDARLEALLGELVRSTEPDPTRRRLDGAVYLRYAFTQR